jgi:hypothetical protein
MDEISIARGERSYVRRRRFFSIERGEVGRERQRTCLRVRSEIRLPARRDQVSCGAPLGHRFAAGVGLWRAGREHLKSEDEHTQGEESSCVLHDSCR